MHRLLVVHLDSGALDADDSDAFRVTADSADAAVTPESSRSILESGGTAWEEFDDSTGYSSPYATIPCDGVVQSLGYWVVKPTGNVLDYDFAAAGLSERKVITSGELHVQYDGRDYVGRAGDSMIFRVDPADRGSNGALRPFLVRFLGDQGCTIVYTEYALPE